MPHQLLLNRNRCSHRIKPATVCVPEGVSSDVSDSGHFCGSFKLTPETRIRIGKASQFQRTRKNPIVAPRKLSVLLPSFQNLKQVLIDGEGFPWALSALKGMS